MEFIARTAMAMDVDEVNGTFPTSLDRAVGGDGDTGIMTLHMHEWCL